MLPEALEREVHRLTDTLPDDRAKVKALYDYLGRTTRYVSIQLGIGGLQPMTAEEVYRTKFGDCKALSNYLHALLGACDIPSRYAIIHTRRRRIAPDFASPSQADHAILQVPLPGDTLYLECTNPDFPFGYVHSKIAGHDAVLLGDPVRLAERVTLPDYADTLNSRTKEARIDLAPDGSAAIRIREEYAVKEYERMQRFTYMDRAQRAELIRKRLALPLARIGEIAVEECKSALPTLRIDYETAVPCYGKATGSRLFLPLTPFTPPSSSREKRRTNDIRIEAGRTQTVRVRIALPDRTTVETLPKDAACETPFGRFDCRVRQEEGCVTVEMRLLLRSGRWDREQIGQLRDLLDAHASACNAQIVLKKQ